jgi:kynurenine 3-monooxygenase
LYSQVTFSEIRYSVAYKQGQVQSKIMDEIMEIPNIETRWDEDEVMEKLLVLSGH